MQKCNDKKQMKCRKAVIIFLALKRRFGMDRFIIEYIARIVWSTRKHSGWGFLRHVETMKTTFERKNYSIRLYSFERDDWIEFGLHPKFGSSYTIIQLVRYVMQDGIDQSGRIILNVNYYEFIDEVFLFTQ